MALWDNISGKISSEDDKETLYEKLNRTGKGLPDKLRLALMTGKGLENLPFVGRAAKKMQEKAIPLVLEGEREDLTPEEQSQLRGQVTSMLGANLQGIASGALFNAPEYIYKKLPKGAKEALNKVPGVKQLAENWAANPEAAGMGKVTGEVAQMIGTAGINDAGLWSKAGQAAAGKLPKLGKALSWVGSPAGKAGRGGARLLGEFGKGAIKAAPSAIASTAFDTSEAGLHENPGQKAARAGTSMLLGGALQAGGTFIGDVASRWTPKVKAAISELQKAANKNALGDVGVNQRVLRQQVKYLKTGEEIEDYVDKAVREARKRGLVGVEADANLSKWEVENDKMWDAVEDSVDREGIAKINERAVTNAGTSMKDDNVFMNMSEEDTDRVIEKVYGDLIEQTSLVGSKRYLDRYIEAGRRATDPRGIVMGEAALQIKNALEDEVAKLAPDIYKAAKEDYRILQLFRKADMMEETRIAASQLIVPGSDTAPRMAIMEGGAQAGPKIVKSVLGGIINRLTAKGNGAIARTLLDIVQSGPVQKGLRNAKDHPVLADVISNVSGVVADKTPKLVGPLIQLSAESNGPPAKTLAPIKKAEEQVGEQATEEAKQAVNSAFQERLDKNIAMYYYQLGVGNYGYSMEEWQAALQVATNNYDPSMCAGLLFKGDPEGKKAYVDNYKNYLNYKRIDLEQALSIPEKKKDLWSGFIERQTGVPQTEAPRTEADRLKAVILATTSKLPRAELDRLINQISQLKGYSMQDKIDELERELSVYGFDPNLYRGVGV